MSSSCTAGCAACFLDALSNQICTSCSDATAFLTLSKNGCAACQNVIPMCGSCFIDSFGNTACLACSTGFYLNKNKT